MLATSLKTLSTRAPGNLGAGIPAKVTHKFPGRGKSFNVTANGTNNCEIWVVLQPTETLIVRAAAIDPGILALDGNCLVAE